MKDIQARIEALIEHVVKPMVRFPKDVEHTVLNETLVTVWMRVNAADHPLVRGRERRNQLLLERLFGYVCAQGGKGIRFALDEPERGDRAEIPPFDPSKAFNHFPTMFHVAETAEALFGCACPVTYRMVTPMYHDFIVQAPAGVNSDDLQRVTAAWQPLFKAHGNCIGRRLLVQILPSQEESQPASAAGRFAK